ncbi:MAG: histidine--tRNA ligase [Dehalococcoidia bacterium]|nr:MAG: histidine--tRNA ligase [Dehalococcoidia bacterium]
MYQTPRGTVDILPVEQAYWCYVEKKAALTCQLYGYERIDTPAFENTNLFSRSIGEKTDIVEKEMYSFKDKSGNLITLRPEGTAPICRAYIEHGMQNQPQPVKLYYTTPIFRYERPQAGRYRQHHQFGYEAIGDNDPTLDAEVIDMAWLFFNSLGLSNLKLLLNSIGCHKCRPEYLTSLRQYYSGYRDKLCSNCKVRLDKNTLRLLDCKKEICQQLAVSTPRSIDYLCHECKEHFRLLRDYLQQLGLPFSVNHCLVRGLDYYTRTVFEIQPQVGGTQSTIGGGGRYDDLIEELGGKPTPALGFAAGIERIILNLKRQNAVVPPIPQPQVFIAQTSDRVKNEVIKLASSLRRADIGVLQASSSKSLKAQLRHANNIGISFVIIIDEEEMKTGAVILRNMTTAKQDRIILAELQDKLLGQLQ